MIAYDNLEFGFSTMSVNDIHKMQVLWKFLFHANMLDRCTAEPIDILSNKQIHKTWQHH